MQIKKKKLSGYDTNKTYYWSPSANWKVNGDELTVNENKYTKVASVFPELYFKAQDGATPAELMEELASVNSVELEEFIQDLVRNRVLVPAILTPEEIFKAQSKLFKSEYNEEMFLNPSEVEKFKKSMLNRENNAMAGKAIELKQKEEYPELISRRRSYRLFDTSEKLSFEVFSQIVSVFRQLRSEDEIKYYYASAGGLYPIDIYLYVKDNRVENIPGGLYYYSPVSNSIALASTSCVVTDEAHFFTNKDIYNTSAFSVFFIYNAEVSMPKYAGMAYYYACIDAGIMVGALTSAAELCNIGLCSIGNMNFDKIKKYFKLNEAQVLIHTVEVGLKSENGRALRTE